MNVWYLTRTPYMRGTYSPHKRRPAVLRYLWGRNCTLRVKSRGVFRRIA